MPSRLLVPADIPLGKLRGVLHEVMGWTGSHMHSFVVAGRTLSDPREDVHRMLHFEDERKVKLDSLVGPGQVLGYMYDHGDGWEHDVLVEDRLEGRKLKHPLCIAGARACPPEDSGGPPGYPDFLQILNDPSDEDHAGYLEWVGGYFDPEGFDVNRTNRALRR